MKKIFFACMLSVFFFLLFIIPANAQDKGQKKIHVVVEKNGTVITDTSVFFDKTVSEEEIQAVISDITGEESHPCQARNQQTRHCDTVAYKCRHMQNSELDSLLEISGKPFTHPCTHTDTCRNAEGSHGPCMHSMEKAGAGEEPCKHIEKEIIRTGEPAGEESVIIGDNGDIIIRSGHTAGEKCIKVIVESKGDTAMKGEAKVIRIIETRSDEKDIPEGCTKKTVEKKVMVTEEGSKTEKIIILESQDEAGNKGSETTVTITQEGDKAEKTILLESPSKTQKKTKKEN